MKWSMALFTRWLLAVSQAANADATAWVVVDDVAALQNNISAAAPGVELQLELRENSLHHLASPLRVSGKRKITIFGRGATIACVACSWRAIEVNSGASLTLHDITIKDFQSTLGGCALIASNAEDPSDASSLTLVSSR